jgi:uncharacterized protein (DUF2267 family)
VALHEPLRRGSERSGGKATGMSLDEFVTRVGERTGHSLEQARDDVRAVMVTLREAGQRRRVRRRRCAAPERVRPGSGRR